MCEIIHAASAQDMAEVRKLFQEYADMLGVELCFQGFAEELATLPGKYAPPHGCLLLAKEGENAVGCVALRPMDEPGVCEMKRLYVQPSHRGTGLGRRLAVLIVEEARQRGYTKMRLDTLAKLTAAIQLYRDMGFVAIPEYYRNPLPDVVYMELDLAGAKREQGGKKVERWEIGCYHPSQSPSCIVYVSRPRCPVRCPMVIGYHLIWTVYGWWLPNDPRGSSSQEIRVAHIAELGELHVGRKQVQPRSAELRQFYDKARDLLQHPTLLFTPEELMVIGNVFAQVIEERRYTCYGCAILPEHVHMLIRRHRDKAEEMICNLQQASKQNLIGSGHRAPMHPVWGGPGWKVFLNTKEDVERIVKYIRNNPARSGMSPQTWPFVRTYDGWLPAPLHHRGSSTR